MIFCEQCGNQLNDNAKFCGKCGTPVGAVQEAAPQASAPAACAQCGEPLEEGEAFCANCGAQVGAVQQQYQQAPVQAQWQAENGGDVLKKSPLLYLNHEGVPAGVGHLLFYRDRLEWKDYTLVMQANHPAMDFSTDKRIPDFAIPLDKISSIKIYLGGKGVKIASCIFFIGYDEDGQLIPNPKQEAKSLYDAIENMCTTMRVTEYFGNKH